MSMLLRGAAGGHFKKSSEWPLQSATEFQMPPCGPVQNETSPLQKIIQVESIPPLPATAATLLAMAMDPEVDIDALSRTIESDPPLSARILGTANSAFYAPRKPVLTVKGAIVSVLGLNVVRNIAFGMALTGGLNTSACRHFDMQAYWIMALGTADLASGLARASSIPRPPDPDATYLVGLLHNLGELLLVHLWPRELDEALKRLQDDPGSSLVDHERSLIGVDHWAAGAFLARHWQLPPVVGDCIEHFGSPGLPEHCASMVQVLRAARLWLSGVMAGRADLLRVAGVDDTYCEYRSSAFVDRYNSLTQLARSLV